LTTATKFTPKGGRIEVRLERIASHIEITASDLIENPSSKRQRAHSVQVPALSAMTLSLY